MKGSCKVMQGVGLSACTTMIKINVWKLTHRTFLVSTVMTVFATDFMWLFHLTQGLSVFFTETGLGIPGCRFCQSKH